MAGRKPNLQQAAPEVRASYSRLLKEASQLTIPVLRPGNAESVLEQLAEWLGAPLPAIGTLVQHAAAWRQMFIDMGLGDLMTDVPKPVLTVWLLLCWRYESEALHNRNARVQAWADEGLTIDMANRKEGQEIADSFAVEIYRTAAE